MAQPSPPPVGEPDPGRFDTEPPVGELEIVGRLLTASNGTFLTRLTPESGAAALDCVYKPVAGERPLWDFPDQTLALREVAAFAVSRAAGFHLVPATSLIDGPLGPGSLQVWVGDPNDPGDAGLVELVPSDQVPPGWFAILDGLDADESSVTVVHADDPRLRRMALLDVILNNADRKGGHIVASGERVFGVDHGISFHVEPKLRTVLWGWSGERLTEPERELVSAAAERGPDAVGELLSGPEVEAMVQRCATLLRTGRLPRVGGGWPQVPWPPF